jgi:hypothetical protein
MLINLTQNTPVAAKRCNFFFDLLLESSRQIAQYLLAHLANFLIVTTREVVNTSNSSNLISLLSRVFSLGIGLQTLRNGVQRTRRGLPWG